MGDAIVLDCETTGFDPEHDRVIELSIIPLSSPEFLFNTKINPGRSIQPKITEITGITDEMVRDKPRIDEHAAHIRDIIASADAVIGYNIAFDKRMISADLKRCGIELVWPILVDPLRIWDVYEPREKRDLQNAYKRFVSKDGFAGAHGAAADTIATRDVLLSQRILFGIQDTPWDQLDPDRKSWWGPTKHIKIVENILVMNFGKHEGRPVCEVDSGFWNWILKKDFPDHVGMLAVKMLEFMGKHRGGDLHVITHTWAIAYQEQIK